MPFLIVCCVFVKIYFKFGFRMVAKRTSIGLITPNGPFTIWLSSRLALFSSIVNAIDWPNIENPPCDISAISLIINFPKCRSRLNLNQSASAITRKFWQFTTKAQIYPNRSFFRWMVHRACHWHDTATPTLSQTMTTTAPSGLATSLWDQCRPKSTTQRL